ncbi:hypothetical protein F4780DRAFT_361986 [Xylariomycetidae sp. FL0641]|nr:hypothetical protein F4780DRAFT_361986 [Xylariomycetidae sp. FL0641]
MDNHPHWRNGDPPPLPPWAIPGDSQFDDTSRFLMPEGLAATILAITIILFTASTLAVPLRAYVRFNAGSLGIDDWLMLVALLFYMTDCGLVAYDCFVGLGSVHSKLSLFMKSEGIKYILLWQVFYMLCLGCVKVSICMTLIRLAVERLHRILIWAVMAITAATSLVGFVGVLSVCRPISANWNVTSPGHCADPSVITGINYMVSASSILTDWSCALLPVLMLWKAQMRTEVKVSVGIVLGLGAVASISTIIRMPYIRFYKIADNYLYNIGNIVLWSIFECGVGLIAGSLPMLRRFFRRWVGHPKAPHSAELRSFATFGGTPPSNRPDSRHAPIFAAQAPAPAPAPVGDVEAKSHSHSHSHSHSLSLTTKPVRVRRIRSKALMSLELGAGGAWTPLGERSPGANGMSYVASEQCRTRTEYEMNNLDSGLTRGASPEVWR